MTRKLGVAAFLRYQRGVELSTAGSDNPLWRSFIECDIPFFMADTRTEREHRDARTIRKARMISDRQFDELCDWLSAHRKSPKFVASPAILLPRRRTSLEHEASALRSDAWDGYPATFHRLLAFLWEESIERCIFLSGSEGLSCQSRAELSLQGSDSKSLVLYSIHCTGLYSPYPLANSVEKALAGDRKLHVSSPASTQSRA